MANVLLHCQNPVGPTMAGPAIRYWELARSLSRNHEVTLLVPNACDLPAEGFTVIVNSGDYIKHLRGMDAAITMNITPSLALAAKWHGVKMILDAYDPQPFEMLESNKKKNGSVREKELNLLTDLFNFSFNIADAVLCANENQRDLWTGMMLSLKNISPSAYDLNPSWKDNIAIVPFGLPAIPPMKQGMGPRELFNLKQSDKIVLWGGGIWDWFDPLTLIKAIHCISQKRKDIHLVFMAACMPGGTSDEMTMSAQAYQLAKGLDILDKHVFFHGTWIPYEQRTAFLLEADIGISTHFNHLETRYAFRTRLLDYIWAGLPIINTEGDSFSRLIVEKGVGLTVPYEDVEALANAILYLFNHADVSARMKDNLKTLSKEFYWDKVTEPLEKIITSPWKKTSKIFALKHLLESIYRMKGPLFPFKIAASRLFKKLCH